MDYTQEYKQKLVTAKEAVKIIESGDWVDYGWCNGTPDLLDRALAERTDELDNRSEEHTSELQSGLVKSYAGFCLKEKHKS